MSGPYTPEQIREARLDDFRVFLRQVWDHLGLPAPTPVQNDVAKALQSGDDRMVIQAFRGMGKSFILVAFAAWTLFLDPQKKIMVVSAGETLAKDFSHFLQQLINTMPLLQHLRPRPGQRTSVEAWDVGPATPDKSPSVKSVGITGQLTGSRADLIIPDDIETPKNAYTHLLRERIAELIKEFDAVLKPGGRIVYLGTPQVESSLYTRLPGRGYKVSIWPVQVPEKPDNYGGQLAPWVTDLIAKGAKPGMPLEPQRFPEQEIESRRVSYGSSGFALQFMLDTNPASREKYPLKCKNLMVMDLPEEGENTTVPVKAVWGQEREQTIQDLQCGGLDLDRYVKPAWVSDDRAGYTETVMTVDPAAGGNDETAYAVGSLAFGKVFLRASGGFKDGFSEQTLKTLAGVAARYGVQKIQVEKNYGGGMFSALLKPHVAKVCSARFLDDVHHSTQKESRILDSLEPVLGSHRLIVARALIEADLKQQADDQRYSLIWQMTRMHRVKGALPNEDRLEAVAMLCSYFTDKLQADQDKLAEQREEDQYTEMVERLKSRGIVIAPSISWAGNDDGDTWQGRRGRR